MAFLDKTGLEYLVGKIKTYVQTAISNVTITRAKLAQDALFSPCIVSGTRNIKASDIGCTIQNSWNVTATYTLTQAVSAALPMGAEMAFLRSASSTSQVTSIVSSGVRFRRVGETTDYKNKTLKIADLLGIVAIRKVASDGTNGDLWVVIGEVET